MKPSLILFLGLIMATSMRAASKPNILFIMSDDHAAHGISAYGGRLAKIAPTPNLDRLAQEGALFQNAFCQLHLLAFSACVRQSVQPRNGAVDLGGRVEPGKQMLAIEMKKAGYESAMIGKWHLKVEPKDFDYYCVLPGQGKYHGPSFRVRGDKPWGKNLIEFPNKHSTDAITDLTLEWLKKRKADKPFFLMHHYKAPHDYFENAERYESYLAEEDVPEPETLWKKDSDFGSLATRGNNDELIPHIGTSIGNRNPRRSYLRDLPQRFPREFPENYDPVDYTDEQNTRFAYNAYLKKFLRCVKGIDDNLGRLFKHLEETGQMDNTVIIYTGDQGFMLGEHDYQDKRWMYEESMRMPFLVRYPKTVKAGQRFDTIIENVDYAPTMLDFANAKIPKTVQGRSFKSLLETGKEAEDWKKAAYYRYWMHMAHHDNPAHLGMRTKRYKLIYFYGCNYQGGYQTPAGWELYDMKEDPHETKNLYHNPKYAKLASSLKNWLAKVRLRVGDDGSHYPDCEKIVQEFWDYDEADQTKARKISAEYLARRKSELENDIRNVRTSGKP